MPDQEMIVWGDTFQESMESLLGSVRIALTEVSPEPAELLEGVDEGELEKIYAIVDKLVSRNN